MDLKRKRKEWRGRRNRSVYNNKKKKKNNRPEGTEEGEGEVGV